MHPEPAMPVAMRRSLLVIVCALLLTVGFHFLIYGYLVGVPFALFVLLLIGAIQAVVFMSGKRGNTWAYVFCIPIFFGLVTQALYDGEPARLFSFCIVLASGAFFTFWLAAPPRRLRDLPALWPASFFRDTLLPFRDLSKLLEPFSGKGGPWKGIVSGGVIAIPFLLVFAGLFLSADTLVRKTVDTFFGQFRLDILIQRGMADILVGIFLLGLLWTVLHRLQNGHDIRFGEQTFRISNSVATTTFLTLLNVLFLGFLVFQFIYFFGGEALVQAQGLRYADYARNGFFELLAVSGIVSAILFFLYRYEAMQLRWVRISSSLLIVQTGVVIVSAVRRMLLYIDVYGMSLQRYWAMAGILFIGLGLAVTLIAILARVSFARWSTAGFIVGISLLAVFTVLDAEAYIAKYNVDRFLSGNAPMVDIRYLTEDLSSDAVPELVRLANAPWPAMSFTPSESDAPLTRAQLLEILHKRKESLEKKFTDWRRIVLSDYRALASLSLLKP